VHRQVQQIIQPKILIRYLTNHTYIILIKILNMTNTTNMINIIDIIVNITDVANARAQIVEKVRVIIIAIKYLLSTTIGRPQMSSNSTNRTVQINISEVLNAVNKLKTPTMMSISGSKTSINPKLNNNNVLDRSNSQEHSAIASSPKNNNQLTSDIATSLSDILVLHSKDFTTSEASNSIRGLSDTRRKRMRRNSRNSSSNGSEKKITRKSSRSADNTADVSSQQSITTTTDDDDNNIDSLI
jgi:hypothetical protein